MTNNEITFELSDGTARKVTYTLLSADMASYRVADMKEETTIPVHKLKTGAQIKAFRDKFHLSAADLGSWCQVSVDMAKKMRQKKGAKGRTHSVEGLTGISKEMDSFDLCYDGGSLYKITMSPDGEDRQIIANDLPASAMIIVEDGVESVQVKLPNDEEVAFLMADYLSGKSTKQYYVPAPYKNAELQAYLHLLVKYATKQVIVTKLGWTLLEDEEGIEQWNYIHPGGVIGPAKVTPKLPESLAAYAIDMEGDPKEQLARFMRIRDATISDKSKSQFYAQLAYMIKALAYPVFERDQSVSFGLYVHGGSETFKTSTTQLIMNFVGRFSFTNFTSNFESTSKDIAVAACGPRHNVSVVDDYKPSINSKEQETSITRLSALVGDKASRGTLQRTGKRNIAPAFEGGVIITAEMTKLVGSRAARWIYVETDGGWNTEITNSMQNMDCSAAARGFLEWLRPQMDSIVLPDVECSVNRTSRGIASLKQALMLFAEYCESISAEFDLQDGLKALEVVAEANEEMYRDTNYYEVFIKYLKSALEAGHVNIAPAEGFSQYDKPRGVTVGRRTTKGRLEVDPIAACAALNRVYGVAMEPQAIQAGYYRINKKKLISNGKWRMINEDIESAAPGSIQSYGESLPPTVFS